MIYFSSDHHFFDKGILRRKDKQGNLQRNFNDITEHNNHVIKQHNQTVKPSDTIYLLGDICFDENKLNIVSQLNGNKILVLGNHDKFNSLSYLNNGIQKIQGAIKLKYNHKRFILTHIPISEYCFDNYALNIHGHLHNKTLRDKRYVNVCMERINYIPISIDEVFTRYL